MTSCRPTPLRLFALALLISCAAGERPTPHTAGDGTALPAVQQGGAVAIDAGAAMPVGDAPLCLSLDLGTFDSWLGTLAQRVPQDIVDLLDREFDGLASELRRGAPLQLLGLDTVRPATLLVAPLDPSVEPAVEELATLAGQVTDRQPMPPDGQERFEALSRRIVGAGVWVRVTLPVDGAPRLLDLVRRAVGREARATPPGYELLLSEDGGPAVAVWRDGASLVADAWVPFGQEGDAGAQAVVLRARSISWPSWAPAPVSGISTVAMQPSRLSRLAFAQGVSMVRRALASVDSSYVGAIVTAGLQEAHRAITIAEGVDGIPFQRVFGQVHADEAAPGGELVAELRPGAVIDSAAAAPMRSLTATGVSFVAQVAPASLGRLRLPGLAGSTEPGRAFARAVQEAGVWGFLLAVPYGLPWAGNLLIEEVSEKLPAGGFESVGVIRVRPEGGSPTSFGVLPAGTTAAQARCSLVPEGSRCGRSALRPGVTVAARGGWARLQRIGDRWVVLAASERDGVELSGVALGAPFAGPMRVALDGSAFVRGVPELAWTAPLVGRPWALELRPAAGVLRATLQSGAAP